PDQALRWHRDTDAAAPHSASLQAGYDKTALLRHAGPNPGPRKPRGPGVSFDRRDRASDGNLQLPQTRAWPVGRAGSTGARNPVARAPLRRDRARCLRGRARAVRNAVSAAARAAPGAAAEPEPARRSRPAYAKGETSPAHTRQAPRRIAQRSAE